MTCHLCNQEGYKRVREGWLCRGHYVVWLEKAFGVWVKYSNEYQKARGHYTPAPLFQEMELKP